ncbi:hypothetical protein [Ligilactobacillus saerimneri]|uniref:hypothetical protein n=1 Tax=Ligilactobacillus saerimneri TaxID=228229 RepID=UPI001C11B0C3|nr:hypothetical protein [Ligilactobacillus saerimneri]MBU5308868.1 hypothetical protein [Ligilactobacillus saerimneri]
MEFLLTTNSGDKFYSSDDVQDMIEQGKPLLVKNQAGEVGTLEAKDIAEFKELHYFNVFDVLGKHYLVDGISLDDLQATVDRLGQSDGWLNVWSNGETLELTKVKATSISSISLTVTEEVSDSIELPLLYLENEPASADTTERKPYQRTADTEADKGEADNGANV